MFDGINPEYSNNKLVAYSVQSEENCLFVKNISTGKVKECSSKRIGVYKFSPDDKFIAFTKNYSSFAGNGNWDIRVWDYDNWKVEIMLRLV